MNTNQPIQAWSWQRVWKYSLRSFDQVISLPFEAQLLKVGEQNGLPTLWFLVDPKFTTAVNRRFVVCGTGQDIGVKATYLDTYFSGPFVWHVFEANTLPAD